MKRLIASIWASAVLLVGLQTAACAQTINQLPAASLPLAGTEPVAVWQGSATKKAPASAIGATAPVCTGTAAGLVPSTTPSGKFLSDNCTWQTAAGAGTVTSVAVSGGTTGLTTSGGPIMGAGTITLGGTLGPANGGTGATGVPSAGQIPIGTGSVYAPATLTAGANVSITNGSGSIIIASTAGGGLSTVFDVVNSYGANNAGSDPLGINETAFKNAKAACVAANGGIIYYGAGTFAFTGVGSDPNALVVPPKCSFKGAAAGATILKPSNLSGNFITVDNSAANTEFAGFQIQDGGSWTGKAFVCCGANTHVHDIFVNTTTQGIYQSSGTDSWWDHVQALVPSTSGPIVQCDNGVGGIFGARWSNSAISGNSSSPSGIGFRQGADCNSLTLDNVDVLFTDTCFIEPSGGGSFTVMGDYECDGSLHGTIWNGGTGINVSHSFLGGGSAGNNVTFGSTFNGFATIASSQSDLALDACIFIGGSGGINITGNNLSGCGTGNVVVAPNINSFTVVGNTLGGLGSGPYGVIVSTGTSNYYTIGLNTCPGGVTTCISDGGTGANKFVTGNVGP